MCGNNQTRCKYPNTSPLTRREHIALYCGISGSKALQPLHNEGSFSDLFNVKSARRPLAFSSLMSPDAESQIPIDTFHYPLSCFRFIATIPPFISPHKSRLSFIFQSLNFLLLISDCHSEHISHLGLQRLQQIRMSGKRGDVSLEMPSDLRQPLQLVDSLSPTVELNSNYQDRRKGITKLTVNIPSTSSSAVGRGNSSTSRELKTHPSRWKTPEFMFYGVAFLVVVPLMVWIPIQLSQSTSFPLT